MRKSMTITLEEEVYDGLHQKVKRGEMSRFIEEVLRPYVLESVSEEGYEAMAKDEAREREAMEWCHALAGETLHDEAK